MSINLAGGLDLRILEVLGIVLALIVLDFVVGFFKSLVPPVTTSVQKFPGQLVSFVLPYFVPLFALAAWVWLAPFLNVAGVTGGSAATFFTLAAGTALKAIADIGSKIGVTFTPAAAPAPPPPAAKA